MRVKSILSLFAFLGIVGLAVDAGAVPIDQYPTIQTFIKEMVNGHSFDHGKLTTVFKNAKIRPRVLEKMMRPYEAKPWYQYRALFVTPKRIKAGVVFWNKYEKSLKIAEKRYGVPASMIVAIIGVETNYGRQPYEFRVIDALTTLAFKYPRRAKFFQSELEQYLLLAREHKFNPMDLSGSYAGAIGLPQFMPSSYRKYAINMSGPRVDLLHNGDDAIASVGNYLMSYGWKQKSPVAVRARVHSKHPPLAKKRRYRPKKTLGYYQRLGVRPVRKFPSDTRVVLIRLQNRKGHEYWLGFNNFYVITRYNSSAQYALAAYELSREVLKERLAERRYANRLAKEKAKAKQLAHRRKAHVKKAV